LSLLWVSVKVPSRYLRGNSFCWAINGVTGESRNTIAIVFEPNHQAECDKNESDSKPPESACSSESLAKGDIDISPLDVTRGNNCFTRQPMVEKLLLELLLSLMMIISIIEHFLRVGLSKFEYLLSSSLALHGPECHESCSILAVCVFSAVEFGDFIFVVKLLLLVLHINLFEFSILLDKVDDLLVHKLHRIRLLTLATQLVHLVDQNFLFAVKRIHCFKEIGLFRVVLLEYDIRDFPGTLLLDSTKLKGVSFKSSFVLKRSPNACLNMVPKLALKHHILASIHDVVRNVAKFKSEISDLYIFKVVCFSILVVSNP